MKNKMLYACYASSDYYSRETGISMIGFFENNPDYEPEMIFILDYGIQAHNREKLDSIATSYGKRIEYIPAKSILEDIQKRLDLKDFRGSLATYSRAFIDKIMPEFVERLLYIDSDTVVVGSVSELKDFPMGDACMAGIVVPGFSNRIKKGKTILYSGNSAYYGCGIVLFDVANWRTNDCYTMIVNVLSKKKRYPCADQTLINNAIPERLFRPLPFKYNYTHHQFNAHQEPKMMASGGWHSEADICEAISHPVVIHYPGSPVNRPWYEKCQSRRKDEYYKYKSLSPWKDTPLYSFSEYKASLEGFHQKFGYWIHQQEIYRTSYTLVCAIKKTRSAISDFFRFLKLSPQLPSEGIEPLDNK